MKADKNKHDKNEDNKAQNASENETDQVTKNDSVEPEESVTTEISEETPDLQNENPLLSELESERERYVRLYAEYDNFRKRSKKERETVYSEVRADTVLRFLPVYDNLVRALAQETTDEAYRRGVEMTMEQMREILGKLGVKEIPSVGEIFDPALHNAVMHIDDPEKMDGEIVEEFEKGFVLGDKVIRFSMVKVAN